MKLKLSAKIINVCYLVTYEGMNNFHRLYYFCCFSYSNAIMNEYIFGNLEMCVY